MHSKVDFYKFSVVHILDKARHAIAMLELRPVFSAATSPGMTERDIGVSSRSENLRTAKRPLAFSLVPRCQDFVARKIHLHIGRNRKFLVLNQLTATIPCQ
jgi:hypothetical protein